MTRYNKNDICLTSGEELWLDRRTRGETQAEAAIRLRVGRTSLWGAERDLAPLKWSPKVNYKFTPGDLLALAQRRSGLTRAKVAWLLKVSRVTLAKWERTGDKRLVIFWVGRGTNVKF